MTGICHESSAAICEAATWLNATSYPQRPYPIVPAIRERFGLNASEAITAIREANKAREVRDAAS
ncbi:MAG: hypothetical protein WBA44_11610 [Mesorhizobium sp.]